MSREGFVYLLKADTGVYKIGRSKDPTARLNGMGTLPFVVELVHQVATNDAAWLERGMHRRFAKRHVRGEWYALTAADVARIVAVDRCDRPQLLRRPKRRHCPRLKKGNGMLHLPLPYHAQLKILSKRTKRTITAELLVCLNEHFRTNAVEPTPLEDQP